MDSRTSFCCSVAKLCPTLCDPMDCSTPGSSVLHYLPEFAQIHAHWVGDAIQSSHPLPPPSPFAFSLSQLQGLFLKFIYFNWRLITLQYCSGFCHTLTWISHGWGTHVNTCKPQGLFHWVGSLHLVAKVLQLQHQSFQCIFKIDFP